MGCAENMRIGILAAKRWTWARTSRKIWFEKKISSKIKTTSMSNQKKEMFGAIFGHLESQKKDQNLVGRMKSGDIVTMRAYRKDRDSSTCSLEIKYNKDNWQVIKQNIKVPIV